MMRFEATATGDSKLVETLKKTVRTQDDLILKVGAKVMFIKNNAELGVSNGTMGELISFAAVKIDDKESSDALIKGDSSDDVDEDAASEKTTKGKKSAAKKDKEKPKSKKPTTRKMPVVRLIQDERLSLSLKNGLLKMKRVRCAGKLLTSAALSGMGDYHP